MKPVLGAMCRVPHRYLSSKDVKAIENELQVVSRDETKSLKLFRKVKAGYVLPRAWAVQRLGLEAFEDRMVHGAKIKLRFKGKLDESTKRNQVRIVNEILDAVSPGEGGQAQAPCGYGKCLGRGTPVILADGRVVPVESIRVGDRLMGPDGRPRAVLSTNAGVGPLYRIEPIKGEPWVCNDVHVLTLIRYTTGAVIDIQLDDWQKKSKTFRSEHQLFSVGVDSFDNSIGAPDVDPYFLGVWFGAGVKQRHQVAGSTQLSCVAISKPDPEVTALCEDTAAAWNLKLRIEGEPGSPTYRIVGERGAENPLLDALRRLVGPDLRVPDSVLRGQRAVRLQFLAGFLDANAELQQNCFTVSQQREDWARAIWWIARSLGLCATLRTRRAREQHGTEGTYYVVGISGDTASIPTRIPRRQARPGRQPKAATRTGFTATPIGTGEYFGFTLDGDGRFLLGDFTVTHNTVMGLYCIAQWGRTALVFVHTEFLADQWIERALQFTDIKKHEIGRVQRDRCDFEGKKLVLAVTPSVAKSLSKKATRCYPPELFSWPGVVVFDEVHRYGASMWHTVMGAFPAAIRLGLSATPFRKDGMTPVITHHIGPLVSQTKVYQERPTIYMLRMQLSIPLKAICYWVGGRPSHKINLSRLITRLAREPLRNQMIADYIADAVRAGRKILVLTDRLPQIDAISALLPDYLDKSIGIGHYVGGKTREERAEAAKQQLVFGTYQLASEGLDITDLDTLFMATPRANVEQSVGRILRHHKGKKAPIVVDIHDVIPITDITTKLAGARERFYCDQNWVVEHIRDWASARG